MHKHDTQTHRTHTYMHTHHTYTHTTYMYICVWHCIHNISNKENALWVNKMMSLHQIMNLHATPLTQSCTGGCQAPCTSSDLGLGRNQGWSPLRIRDIPCDWQLDYIEPIKASGELNRVWRNPLLVIRKGRARNSSPPHPRQLPGALLLQRVDKMIHRTLAG